MKQPMTNRRALLAVDAFALANADEFRAAYGLLVKSLPGIAPEKIGGIIDLYELAIRCGEFTEQSILETIPRVCSALIVTVYGHLAIGAPLFMNAALLGLWELTAGLRQCPADGYRQPAVLARCSVCGGEVVETGSFEERAARMAAMN